MKIATIRKHMGKCIYYKEYSGETGIARLDNIKEDYDENYTFLNAIIITADGLFSEYGDEVILYPDEIIRICKNKLINMIFNEA